MNHRIAALALLHAPTSCEVAPVGVGMENAFRPLAKDPGPGRIAMARAQLPGVAVRRDKLRRALQCESQNDKQ